MAKQEKLLVVNEHVSRRVTFDISKDEIVHLVRAAMLIKYPALQGYDFDVVQYGGEEIEDCTDSDSQGGTHRVHQRPAVMGSKLQPGSFDCYANALPDEPMFILLARDPSAPDLVLRWANIRDGLIGTGAKPVTDIAMVREAVTCSTDMELWRKDNWPRRKQAREANPASTAKEARGFLCVGGPLAGSRHESMASQVQWLDIPVPGGIFRYRKMALGLTTIWAPDGLSEERIVAELLAGYHGTMRADEVGKSEAQIVALRTQWEELSSRAAGYYDENTYKRGVADGVKKAENRASLWSQVIAATIIVGLALIYGLTRP